jgi:hypothetical protein
MTASRLPRRTKAAAASTERVSKLLKDQICANYNTILINFNRNDVQNTGKVDSRELLKVMARCNIPMTEHQAGEIVALLDPDDQGRSVMLLDEPASNRSFCSCPRECLRSPPCREAGPVPLSMLGCTLSRIHYRDFLAIFYVQMPSLHGEKNRPMSSLHPASAGLPAVSRMQTPLVT